jgi:hypothetical protein
MREPYKKSKRGLAHLPPKLAQSVAVSMLTATPGPIEPGTEVRRTCGLELVWDPIARAWLWKIDGLVTITSNPTQPPRAQDVVANAIANAIPPAVPARPPGDPAVLKQMMETLAKPDREFVPVKGHGHGTPEFGRANQAYEKGDTNDPS